MKETWDIRIKRAERLSSDSADSNELLTFYASLLRSQKDIYEYLRTRKDWLPCGDLVEDLPVVLQSLATFLGSIEANGPDKLASEARSLLQATVREQAEMLMACWQAPSDLYFFAKAFLQPYASWLREIGAKPVGRNLGGGENRCPFCAGKPQVSVLQIKEASSESGGRDLVCATCLNIWPFRRVVCANCGEEDPAKVGYYSAPDYGHIRVEACETCRHYIKGVDLTRYGFAVPVVDEVAAAPLDLWAVERGYIKIEMNLLGF